MAGGRRELGRQQSADSNGGEKNSEKIISLGSEWMLFFPVKCTWMVSFPLEWKSAVLCSKHNHTIPFQRNEKLQNSCEKPLIQTLAVCNHPKLETRPTTGICRRTLS
jgi:hypothetical protein